MSFIKVYVIYLYTRLYKKNTIPIPNTLFFYINDNKVKPYAYKHRCIVLGKFRKQNAFNIFFTPVSNIH